MATSQRIEELIKLLINGTKNGTLKWEPSADEYTFRLSSRTANVRITKEETVGTFRRLTVINEVGRVIEEYSPKQANEIEEFDELFDEARRSASNTDEVLDELMKELSKGVKSAPEADVPF